MHSPNSIKSKFSPNRILPLSFSDLIPLNVSMVIVWLLPLERFENYSILTVHVNLLVIFYRFRKRVILLDKITFYILSLLGGSVVYVAVRVLTYNLRPPVRISGRVLHVGKLVVTCRYPVVYSVVCTGFLHL